MSSWNADLVKTLEEELELEYKREESYWAQKSWIQWLQLGDRNTSYFHGKVIQRRKRNTIVGLRDSCGNWKTSLGDIQSIACGYFQYIYSSTRPCNFWELHMRWIWILSSQLHKMRLKQLFSLLTLVFSSKNIGPSLLITFIMQYKISLQVANWPKV